MTSRPRITVLMATYNGMRWLPEQVASILAQDGVDLRIIVSDDGSTDGTVEWLGEYDDARVQLLSGSGPGTGAAGNFYRLLRDADLDPGVLVAFSDQDDVWLPGKLAAQAALVAAGYDGVSSDVTAVAEDGRRTLVRKSYPQRRLDYLLEGPGPGCTFLLSPRLVSLVRSLVADPGGVAASVDFHDWLIYAVCRAAGWPWLISDVAWVDYRQHASNAMGADIGARAKLRRLRRIAGRWHRCEAAKLAEIARSVAPAPQAGELEAMSDLLRHTGPGARLNLARRAGSLRRRPRDRWAIAVLTLGGLW